MKSAIREHTAPLCPSAAVQRAVRFYDFAGFRVDTSRRCLQTDHGRIRLTARLFDLLVFLLRERHRAVSRTELLDALWPGVVVEDANLSVNISLLRKVLHRNDAGACYIETLPRVGYRFCAEVVESLAEAGRSQGGPRWHACRSALEVPHVLCSVGASG
jgi:DNA-binding winged helix-turn-helix (wHTH) protein